jgi:hypothetical protein
MSSDYYFHLTSKQHIKDLQAEASMLHLASEVAQPQRRTFRLDALFVVIFLARFVGLHIK